MKLPARLIFLLLFLCHQTQSAQLSLPRLDSEQLMWLGDRIYSNECNKQTACLTTWNQGEDFPSLGIGHFIWYRQGQSEIYTETFPALLDFLQREGVQLPSWLDETDREQPWPDRAAFMAATDDESLVALRKLLSETTARQTAFIAERFRLTVPQLLDSLPESESLLLESRISRIANSDVPMGMYALIDYVHFKGTGLNPDERYQGEGWGLLQVLQQMEDNEVSPLTAFVRSASAVLQRRVTNAPVERQEQRWLNGWLNRLDTYLPPAGNQ